MTEIYLRKTSGKTMIPCDQDSHDYIKKLSIGQEVRCKITRARNLQFHRKFFAMINHAYDVWEPESVEVPQYLSIRGVVPQKSRDRFRKDLLILAGFYDTTIRLNGEVRLEARSIAFDNMGQDEFDEMYGKVLQVILDKVCATYTKEDFDLVVDEILGFA